MGSNKTTIRLPGFKQKRSQTHVYLKPSGPEGNANKSVSVLSQFYVHNEIVCEY